MTIMGIKSKDMSINFEGSTAAVTKIMNAEPRRIAVIEIVFEMKGVSEQKDRTFLEKAAMTCPVFLSLNTDIEKRISFNWR
jgi:uncharacterized OsmC-like protein